MSITTDMSPEVLRVVIAAQYVATASPGTLMEIETLALDVLQHICVHCEFSVDNAVHSEVCPHCNYPAEHHAFVSRARAMAKA